MVHKGMQRWLCNYVYQTFMESESSSMATELKVSDRILDRALKREDSPEGRLVFELCVQFMVENGVDLNEVFRAYFNEDE